MSAGKTAVDGDRPPLQFRAMEDCFNLLVRCEMNGQRQNDCAHFAAWNFNRSMQRAGASFTQKSKGARPD
jgi:hypothetical protein